MDVELVSRCPVKNMQYYIDIGLSLCDKMETRRQRDNREEL